MFIQYIKLLSSDVKPLRMVANLNILKLVKTYGSTKRFEVIMVCGNNALALTCLPHALKKLRETGG